MNIERLRSGATLYAVTAVKDSIKPNITTEFSLLLAISSHKFFYSEPSDSTLRAMPSVRRIVFGNHSVFMFSSFVLFSF